MQVAMKKSDTGITSITLPNGTRYDVKDGLIMVDPSHVAEIRAFGFEEVKEEAEQKSETKFETK